MVFVALFFAGAFLCNSLPHLIAGLLGDVFPTPFAKPRGKGPSSPLVNVLWGAANLLVGLFLLSRHPFPLGLNTDMAALLAGALLLALFSALHFGKARRDGFK